MRIGKISLYIIAMNEEKRLGKVLESARGLVDEIIIVDSGSTDRTEEIARAYGARFIFHAWESVGQQVKFAEEQCSHKWVLRLDADEVLSPELADEILKVRETGGKDGYYFKISELYPGFEKPHPWVKHYTLIRLYDRDAYSMSGRIGHDDVEKLKPDASAGRLRGFVHHYSFLSISATVEKRNLATDRQVDRAIAEGKRYSPWRMVGAMSLNFLKFFILDRFFLYGFWGFIHSVNIAYMRFLKFSKYYERGQMEKYQDPD